MVLVELCNGYYSTSMIKDITASRTKFLSDMGMSEKMNFLILLWWLWRFSNRELAARVKRAWRKLGLFWDEIWKNHWASLHPEGFWPYKQQKKLKFQRLNIWIGANLIGTPMLLFAGSAKSRYLKFFVMQQMKPNVLPYRNRRTAWNVKVVVLLHQRLLAAAEGQLSLASAPEWGELLQPTVIIFKNQMPPQKEVVEKVSMSMYLIQMMQLLIWCNSSIHPDEMAELQRRVAESNKQVEDF